MGKFALVILVVMTLAQPAFAATDKYKLNPFTNKLDNIGDGTATGVYAATGELVCPFLVDGSVIWAICEIPVPPSESRLLAENDNYLTTEDDKFISL